MKSEAYYINLGYKYEKNKIDRQVLRDALKDLTEEQKQEAIRLIEIGRKEARLA